MRASVTAWCSVAFESKVAVYRARFLAWCWISRMDSVELGTLLLLLLSHTRGSLLCLRWLMALYYAELRSGLPYPLYCRSEREREKTTADREDKEIASRRCLRVHNSGVSHSRCRSTTETYGQVEGDNENFLIYPWVDQRTASWPALVKGENRSDDVQRSCAE